MRRMNRWNQGRPVDGNAEPRFSISPSAVPPVQPLHGGRTMRRVPAPAFHRRYPSPKYTSRSGGGENSAEGKWLAFLWRSQTIHRNSREEMQIRAESSPEGVEAYWLARNKELDAFIEDATQFVEET